MALFGHDGVVATCPLSGAKQTSVGAGSKTDLAWMTAVGAKRPFQTSAASGAGVLRDRNDLKLLTGCTYYIPNSFAHQKPCNWGYEGN